MYMHMYINEIVLAQDTREPGAERLAPYRSPRRAIQTAAPPEGACITYYRWTDKYIDTDIDKDVDVDIYIYIYVCMYVCIYAYIYIDINTPPTHTHTYV